MSDLDDTYKYVCDCIVHEDSLISLRLNWFLVIQGLLFSAYALSIKNSSLPSINTCHFQRVISGMGIATSFFVLPSIFSTVIAIKNLEAFWRKKQLKMSKDQREKYPFVTGGVNLKREFDDYDYMGDKFLEPFYEWQYDSNLAFVTPYGIPIVFLCAWIYLMSGL